MADALRASWRPRERWSRAPATATAASSLGDRPVTIDEGAVLAPSTPTKIVFVGLSARRLIASS
jgi:hypothetical protein